jgi:predicted amidohydrolase
VLSRLGPARFAHAGHVRVKLGTTGDEAMKIALAQITAGADSAANLDRIGDLTARAAAAGARLVLFPEAAMASLPPDSSLAAVAEPLDGPFVSGLADAARRHGLAVVAGMYESIPGDDRVHNTVVALAADGSLLGAYRKIHLYDAFGERESDRIRAGDGETLRFEVEGTAFGVQTCYDVRFPEVTRHLVARGAQVVLLPAAWVRGLLKESHWETLVRARAIECTCYVAAAGMVSRQHCGSSMLVDPMGVPIARAGELEALVVGEVDGERVAAVRRTNPSLANARPDVYSRWLPAHSVAERRSI